jgi:hypothetical protein
MQKIYLSILFVFSILMTQAQCAMCKAVAEQGADQDMGVGGGINGGIIFLVVAAYFCLIGFFLIVFRKKIKGFLKDLRNAGKPGY